MPFFFFHSAFADEAADLGEVVVTASRTAEMQDETLSAITVVDRDDIERLQPRSVADLLRGTPGISIANNGGLGKSTAVYVRGTEADHVLVLVDGVKLGSATSGAASIQDIPVDEIERIEVVRGPFSSLYGSEALGGVIQIFTRKPERPFAPNASFGIGSYETWRASAGVGGRSGRGWYSLQTSHEQADGIDACRGKPSPGGAGCFAYQPDRDGYRNRAATLSGGWQLDDAWSADARAFRSEGKNEYDGTSSDYADSVSQTLGARVRYAPSARLAVTLGAGASADLAQNFLGNRAAGRFDTHRGLGTLQADVGVGPGLLSLGYDWTDDRIDSDAGYARDGRTNRGAFAQWQQTFGAQALQASLRRDDDSQFGGKTTGSVLWGYDLTRALRLTASAGTAYKAPTFNELYYPDYGNPALKPETSRNVELGLRATPEWGGWSLHAFRNVVDDLIAYDATIQRPGNIDRARIRGVEAEADTTLAGWTLRASATWLDPRNDGEGAYRGHLLPRRARWSGRVDADRPYGRLAVGASVYAAGDREDNLANTYALGGYALADLRFAYALSEAWKLQLAANNLFDRRYETAGYYNQPGRNFMLTVRYE